MGNEYGRVLYVIRIILFGVLAIGIMLAAPTGWLYDLWVGEGTQQGQNPVEGVRTIEDREEVEAFFLGQEPATTSGGRLVPCLGVQGAA